MRPSIYTPLQDRQWADQDMKLSTLQIGTSSINLNTVLMENPTLVAKDSASSSRIPFLFRRLKQDGDEHDHDHDHEDGEGISTSSLSSHYHPYRRLGQQHEQLPLHLSFGFSSDSTSTSSSSIDFTNSSFAPLIQSSRNSVAVNPLLSVLTYTLPHSHEQFITPRVSFVKMVNHYHHPTAIAQDRHSLSSDSNSKSDDNGDGDGMNNGIHRKQNDEVQLLQTPYREDFLSYIDFHGEWKRQGQKGQVGIKELIPSSLLSSSSSSTTTSTSDVDPETPLSVMPQPMTSTPKIQYQNGNNPSTRSASTSTLPTTTKIFKGLAHSLILDNYFMDNHRPPLSYLKSADNAYFLSFHEPFTGRKEVNGMRMDESQFSFIKSSHPHQDVETKTCNLEDNLKEGDMAETTKRYDDSSVKDSITLPPSGERKTWIYNETTQIHVIPLSSISDVVLLPKQELLSAELPTVKNHADSLFRRSVKEAGRRITALKDKKRMRDAARSSLDIIQQEAASAAYAIESTEESLAEKMEELRGSLNVQSNAIKSSPSQIDDEFSSSPALASETFEPLKQPSAESDSEHENEDLPEIISFDVNSSDKSTVTSRSNSQNKQGTIPLTSSALSLKNITASVPRTGTQTTPPSALPSSAEDSATSAPFNFSDLKQILIWFLIMVQIQNFVIKRREKRKRRKWMSRVKAYDEAEEQRIQAEMEISRRNRLESRLSAEREVTRIKEEQDERIYAQQEADRRLIEEQAATLKDRELDLLKAEEVVARLMARERKYNASKREKRRKTSKDYSKQKAQQDAVMKAQREAVIRAQVEEEIGRRKSVDVRLRRNSSSPKRRHNNVSKNALTKYGSHFPLQSATQVEQDCDSFPWSPISEDLSDVNSLDIEAFTDAIAMKAAEDAHNRASLEVGWEEIQQGLLPMQAICNDSESDISTRPCFDGQISETSTCPCSGGGAASSVGSSLVGESYVSSADESLVIKRRAEPIVESDEETLSIDSQGNTHVKVGPTLSKDRDSKVLDQVLLRLKAAECQRKKIEEERTGHSNPQTVECFWTDEESRAFDANNTKNGLEVADVQHLSMSPSEEDRTFDMRPLTERRRSPEKPKGKGMQMAADDEDWWDSGTVDL